VANGPNIFQMLLVLYVRMHVPVCYFVAGLLLVVSFGVAMGIVVGGLLLCVVTVLTKRYHLCSVHTDDELAISKLDCSNSYWIIREPSLEVALTSFAQN